MDVPQRMMNGWEGEKWCVVCLNGRHRPLRGSLQIDALEAIQYKASNNAVASLVRQSEADFQVF